VRRGARVTREDGTRVPREENLQAVVQGRDIEGGEGHEKEKREGVEWRC